MKKILLFILTLALVFSVASVAAFADSNDNISQIRDVDLATTPDQVILITTEDDDSLAFPFEDVTNKNWFYEAVVWAVSEKITSGTDAKHFSPDAFCTRGQLVTMLWRAAGSPVIDNIAVATDVEKQLPSDRLGSVLATPEETDADQIVLNVTNSLPSDQETSSLNPFTDVSGTDYFFDAVLWAYSNGIISGTSATTFSPKAEVTREQLVKIIYGYVKTTDAYNQLDEDTNILDFSDASNVSTYAVTPFQWAVGAGVIQGIDSKLAPKAKTTRAQIVTILERVFNPEQPERDTMFEAIYGTPE